MVRMRASTCDVASRTSFDSGGDEDGREPVLRDEAEGAAHGAAHRGNRGMGCLEVEKRGGGVGLDVITQVLQVYLGAIVYIFILPLCSSPLQSFITSFSSVF